MSDINSVNLSGRLGADCELRYTSSGNPVTNMRVAASRVYTNAQGEKQDETTWIRVTVWGKTAEACHKFLGKGSRVGVTGRLQQQRFRDSDGTERTYLQIVADNVAFLEMRPRVDAEKSSDLPPDVEEK
jgi:single-strand DNA-binding protein